MKRDNITVVQKLELHAQPHWKEVFTLSSLLSSSCLHCRHQCSLSCLHCCHRFFYIVVINVNRLFYIVVINVHRLVYIVIIVVIVLFTSSSLLSSCLHRHHCCHCLVYIVIIVVIVLFTSSSMSCLHCRHKCSLS